MTTAWVDALRLHQTRTDPPAVIAQITADLIEARSTTAPHVVAKLARRLNSDRRTIREVAATLTPAQRHGHSMLPRRLPLVPSIADEFRHLELDRNERFILLLAALCTVQRLDLLLKASGISDIDIAGGPLGAHLNVDHGWFDFYDARLSVWILEHADDIDTALAHQRLQLAHRVCGEHLFADWHLARAAVERTPQIVPGLLTEARKLVDNGHPEWAFHVAVEAAEHAEGHDQEAARLIAGTAMISAGYVDDAVEWVGSIFPDGTREHRDSGLVSMLIAETHVHGVVPAIDPGQLRPRSDDAAQWQIWARTAGIAACLCAQRGAHQSMRSWLKELREADARADAGGTIRDPAVALCWMLTGEPESIPLSGTGPFSGAVIGALRAALDGDIESGLQLLVKAQARLVREADPLIAGFELSPLADAYLVVAEVLLRFWRGDVAAAREKLLVAAVELPVGLPFAGLGVTLAHRLDIAVRGTPGVLAHALAETAPSGSRIDSFVDSGTQAYLAGDVEQAAARIALWHDRGAPKPPLAVPSLDEVGPVDSKSYIEPPELAEARGLRRRIRLLPEASWHREYTDIAAAARRLKSPFARARVEAMLGAMSIIRGDDSAGRRHLHAAHMLFEDAGAGGWRDAIAARLSRLSNRSVSNVTTMPISVIQETDPLAASRTVWGPQLTERELDVAMRVVEGLPNREIAEVLEMSVRTVEVHIGRVFTKLGARNRVELTVLAHRTGRHL